MRTLLWLVLLVLVAAPVDGQRRRRGREGPPQDFDWKAYNVPYNGQFTFARVRYQEEGWACMSQGMPGWAHDYPRGERHFARIVSEVTLVDAREDESNILTLDDPELFKYPVAYLSEPGCWVMNEEEMDGLRAYLGKGGFLIVDDFANQDWFPFEQQMLFAFPNLRPIRLDASHSIFDAFFNIETLDNFRHPYNRGIPEFYGFFENNDPNQRMMVIVNYNNDIGDYWEFSDTGWVPIDLTNEAYKLGVNYLIYGMMR